MNNYIILNGINSNTITGLIIQSLPPISKPLMRTNIETIDGKDGDIITKLGYSAYDKEISIGLSYNYNVDDVIEFFNSEGTVIFSNEPTKYYKYTILDQIDFNRLIRFKTATVRMHVQPFKYSTTEEDIEENATETDNEGTNFTLENTENGASFIDVKLKGDTSQDGTPTPSTPVDIDVVTGDNTVIVNNKNLAWTGWADDFVTRIDNSSRASIITKDNKNCLYYSANAGYGSYDTLYMFKAKNGFKENTQYTFSFDIYKETNTNRTFSIYYTDGTYTANTNLKAVETWEHQTVISLPNKTIKYATAFYTSGNTYIDIDTFQCEQGDKETTFEPYKSQSFTLSLGDNELCKIGDYQDYIYPANNTWYIHKDIAKVILNGTRVWSSSSAYTGYARFNCDALSEIVTDNNGYNTHFTQRTTQAHGGYDYLYIAPNTQKVYVQISTSIVSNVTDFKTWLSNNNVKVYYILGTPTDTEITDETLLTQLNALKGATTYEGQTNIITAGDLQPIIYVKTFAMDNPSYTVTNSGNYFAKPVMTIYGMGTVGIYLDGVQVLSLNLNENQTDHITIDVPNMNAYTDTINTLRNRAVTGDYNNLKFNVGDNELSFSGTIQGFIIQNYSRWL